MCVGLSGGPYGRRVIGVQPQARETRDEIFHAAQILDQRRRRARCVATRRRAPERTPACNASRRRKSAAPRRGRRRLLPTRRARPAPLLLFIGNRPGRTAVPNGRAAQCFALWRSGRARARQAPARGEHEDRAPHDHVRRVGRAAPALLGQLVLVRRQDPVRVGADGADDADRPRLWRRAGRRGVPGGRGRHRAGSRCRCTTSSSSRRRRSTTSRASAVETRRRRRGGRARWS